MATEKFDEGSFGTIYDCCDLKKPHHNYVIKISDNFKILGAEVEALIALRKQQKESEYTYPYEYFPRCIDKGMFLFFNQSTSNESNSN